MNRNCLQCGKEFTPAKVGRPQIYCSASCNSKFHQIKGNELSKCPGCSIMFKANWNKQKYCTTNCKRRTTYKVKKGIAEYWHISYHLGKTQRTPTRSNVRPAFRHCKVTIGEKVIVIDVHVLDEDYDFLVEHGYEFMLNERINS